MAKSAISSLVPLIILFCIILVGAGIGFVVYGIANQVADTTSKKMEKHNVSFSKEGLKVGVRGKTAEELNDSTQSTFMKVWNASSWPAYKSRLGWGQTTGASAAGPPQQEKRNVYARTNSAQSAKAQ